jgi:hypothetical protein
LSSDWFYHVGKVRAKMNITSRLDITREMLFEKHDLTSSCFSRVHRWTK